MDTSSTPKENADTPMDTSGVKAGTGDLPQGEMPGTGETEVPHVPVEADAPESSPQGEASGVKAEPHRRRSSGRGIGNQGRAHGRCRGGQRRETWQPRTHHLMRSACHLTSPPTRMMGLHDQGIWGRVETVVGPEAFKAATSAEEKNEKAFENMENAKDNKGPRERRGVQVTSARSSSLEEREKKSHAQADRADERITPQLVFTTPAFEMILSAPSRFNIWPGVSMWIHIPMTKYTLSENDLF